MPLLPDEPSGALTPMTVQLIGATQALAAAQTQRDVLTAVLKPAFHALGAVAGAVLLVDENRRHLQIAEHFGYAPGTPIIWQDNPLDDQVPAADALRLRHALYFEDDGELKAVYPDLEERTGTVAAMATAVLPMFLDGRPLGSLVLDFREPHTFTAEEKYFLRTLAAQCAIALNRAGSLQTLEQRLEGRRDKIREDAHALEAFVAFTEAVGSQTDLPTLMRQAIAVLQSRFSGASIGCYEQQEGLWKARIWSDDMNPELVAMVAAGLPAETPLIAQVLQSRQPVFTDGWDAQQEGVEPSGEYGAAAGYPLTVEGEIHWLMALGLRTTRVWTETDQALVRSVGHGLNLALERARNARDLMLQNAELQARTRALEAFADLTRDLTLTTDPLLLIKRAQEVIMSLLADGASMYYELESDRWISRAQHGSLQSPELQAVVDAGLPYTEAQNLYIPWTTGQPYFQGVYDQRTDNLAPVVGHIGASATLPVKRAGTPVGVLGIVLFDQRAWSTVDRVMLETAVQSLELALDRAAQTQKLEEERTALEAFTRFTEQVGSETDVPVLIGNAIMLLEDTCGVDVVYLERKGDLFKATAWNALFEPTFLVRLQHGFPLKRSSLALVLREKSAAFIDHWSDHQEAAGMVIQESLYLQAVAGYPLFQGNEMQSVLLMASRQADAWTARNKGIFRAVGRSLELALDRAQQTRTVMAQRDALNAQTQELAASTRELEAFSYSVSHDLRTPVRHMIGFLELARKSLDGKLDVRSARYLDMVEQAGRQMNALIDALLELSSTAQQPLKLQVVDLNSVMQEIKATLTPDLLSRNIQWDMTALPTVQGDQAALTQVLTQYIENALKFSRTRDPAVIRVYATDQGETWGIFVQDNGLGFDPRYQERLFNLFQRLHTAQEATGTGVGLASVRRLILKHGGQVFAEGQVGEGATFGFSVPKHSRTEQHGT